MRVFFIFLLISTATFGNALKCYKCNACESTSPVKEECRNDVDPESQISACLTHKIRVGGTAEPMILKKCVTYGKNEGSYNCPALPTGDTISCQTCQGEFCNSAFGLKMNFYILFSMLVFLYSFCC